MLPCYCCMFQWQLSGCMLASPPVVKKVADWNIGITADPSTREASLPATQIVSIDREVMMVVGERGEVLD